MKFFQKYLSVWVILCMIIGVSIGHFFPMIPNILNKFEYAGISIPMAVLIWIMIYGEYAEQSHPLALHLQSSTEQVRFQRMEHGEIICSLPRKQLEN